MGLAIAALVAGLVLLIWSADRFVAGSASAARHFGMPPLLIGMVVVGFGTSSPELLVSALAAADGKAGIALGNAYGSNITNIALILGLTALVAPITVRSKVLRKELPVLAAVTALAAWQASDGEITRRDAAVLAATFAALLGWSIWLGTRPEADALGSETEQELAAHPMAIRRAIFWVVVGLVALVASSRVLVWGAVEIAQTLGVSDLVIGLTVVAAGTSLPELASSVIAARRGEDDIALGNVIGSNLFNTLAVVALAAMIHPLDLPPAVLQRDIPVMAVLTASLFLLGWGLRGAGCITRYEGAALLAAYGAYTAYLVTQARV